MIRHVRGFGDVARVGLVVAAGLLGSACSDAPQHALAVVGAAGAAGSGGTTGGGEPGEVTDDEERLRRLQLVRVRLDEGDEVDVDAGVIVEAADAYCQDTIVPACQTPGPGDLVSLCQSAKRLCMARLLLAAARPQPAPIRFDVDASRFNPNNTSNQRTVVELRQQSTGASRALAAEARVDAWSAILFHLPDALNVYVRPRSPERGDVVNAYAAASGYGDITNLDFAISIFTEAYHLLVNATDTAVETTLAMADAQLGTAADETALRRFLAGKDLSRAAAAHLLVGGADGIEGDTTRTFCTESLHPDVRAAIGVLRDAAPPASLLESTKSIDEVLNTGTDSIRARLGDFYSEPTLLSRGTVEDHFGLDTAAFAAARSYLVQEIKTLGRSKTATLPRRRTLTGTATFDSYAATASELAGAPRGLFAALARHPGTNAAGAPPGFEARVPNVTLTALNSDVTLPLAYQIDVAQTYAAILAKSIRDLRPTWTVSKLAAVTQPLELLRSSHERLGRVALTHVLSGGFWKLRAYAYGFNKDDGIVLAFGDDALRCAVEGTIEGAPCTMHGVVQPLVSGSMNPVRVEALNQDPVSGETQAPGLKGIARVEVGNFPTSGIAERLYFLKPKPGGNYAPGNYTVLAGFPNLRSGETRSLPIIPELDRRVEDILEPSPKNCTRARVECAGTHFDERIPLENELLTDGDGVESSWRQYLTKAREAADRADQRAEEYINAGLVGLQDDVTNEQRHEEQLRIAAEKIQRANEICGSDVDPRTLLRLLEVHLPNKACTVNADCGGGNECVNGRCPPLRLCSTDADCGGARDSCLEGGCVLTVQERVAMLAKYTHLPEYAQLQRLDACLTSADSPRFVSLGTTPVCVWHHPKNRNAVCQKANGSPNPDCPFRPTGGTDGSQCVLPSGADAPANAVVVNTTALGYFSSELPSGAPTPQADRCIALGRARQNPSESSPELRKRIFGTNWENRVWLKEAAKRVRLGHDYDPRERVVIIDDNEIYRATQHFARIVVDGDVRYTTGALQTGPASAGWPCGPRESEDCGTATCSGRSCSLFCRHYDCQDEVGLWNAKRTLVDALVGAQIAASLPGEKITIDLTKYFWRPGDYADPKRYKSSVVNSWLNGPHLALVKVTKDSTSGPLLAERSWFDFTDDGQPASRGMGTQRREFRVPADAERTLLADLLAGRQEYELNLDPTRNDELRVDTAAVLDGYELLCDAMRDDRHEALLTGATPAVNGAADLFIARDHLVKIAETIRSVAANAIFANVPGEAIDNLREQSAIGAYSGLGGDFAETVSDLRAALVDLRSAAPLLASEIAEFGYDLAEVGARLELAEIQIDISQINFFSTLADRAAQCGNAIADAASPKALIGAGPKAMITCTNSVVQISLAGRLAELERQAAEQNRTISIADFGRRASDRSDAIQQLGFRVFESFERIDGALARIEGLRQKAASALEDALYYATYESEAQQLLTRSLGNLFEGRQMRYEAALRDAKRMAWLARRAIEQRLGVSLADMTDRLPLVDQPPADWVDRLCTLKAFEFSDIGRNGAEPSLEFADGYIGDFVTRLENVVESYRLDHGFHEGSDTAVISLRDDILNVRKTCDLSSPNLLANATNLDAPIWGDSGCPVAESGFSTECAAARAIAQPVDFPNELEGRAKAYRLTTGAGASASAGIQQELELAPGRYRVSVYSEQLQGTNATWYTANVNYSATSGLITPVSSHMFHPVARLPGPSGRKAVQVANVFTVREGQPAQVRISVTTAAAKAAGADVWVAAPMLERLEPIEQASVARPFVPSGDDAALLAPLCEDTEGEVFRASRWVYRCVNLCNDGFGTECGGSRAKEYCYHERGFNLSQRAIQRGEVLNYSGFARGNFNYRIESVALNFVGSSTRDCTNAELPSTCQTAGFIPYSIEHNGPFFVRNHTGTDVEALIFDGRIEHARGLALERYLTNPLSNGDAELINQYLRPEFQGRPLDGNFVIRIWDEPGVNFDAIADVQLVLNYRYWTRFE